MPPLPAKRRSELRAEAHRLTPVVIIGDKGLTDEVVAEIDRSLKTHELIKVRAATADRDARNVWLEAICERLGAHPVQQIGKVLVLYRENPKADKPVRAPAPRVRAARTAPREKTRPVPRAGLRGRKPAPSTEARDGPPTPRGYQGRKPSAPRGAGRTGKPPPPAGEGAGEAARRTSHPRSRTPSPPPESAPRRRRRTTSR